MASFCVSCGAALGAQSGFCRGCGARAGNGSPGQPATAGVPQNAMPPAAKSGAMRIVLIVVGVMFVLGVLSVAGMYYTAHRYIKMAEAATGVNAGDVLGSIRNAASHNSH